MWLQWKLGSMESTFAFTHFKANGSLRRCPQQFGRSTDFFLLWDLKFEAEESPWIQFFLSLYSNVLEFQILKKITVQVLLWSIFSLLYCGCHSISMRMEMGKMLVYQNKPFPHLYPTPDTPVSAGILLFWVSLIFAEVLSPAERRVSTAFTG